MGNCVSLNRVNRQSPTAEAESPTISGGVVASREAVTPAPAASNSNLSRVPALPRRQPPQVRNVSALAGAGQVAGSVHQPAVPHATRWPEMSQSIERGMFSDAQNEVATDMLINVLRQAYPNRKSFNLLSMCSGDGRSEAYMISRMRDQGIEVDNFLAFDTKTNTDGPKNHRLSQNACINMDWLARLQRSGPPRFVVSG